MFLMFLMFLIVVIVIIYLKKKGPEDDYNHRKKIYERQRICKKFHNAYLTYWGKPNLANSVYKKYSKIVLSDNSEQWTDYEWQILEDDLKDREREKRLEESRNMIDKGIRDPFVNAMVKNIMNDYPNGYAKYKLKNPKSTSEDIVQDMTTIAMYESEYNEDKSICQESMPPKNKSQLDAYINQSEGQFLIEF